jgi:hypothetical protein
MKKICALLVVSVLLSFSGLTSAMQQETKKVTAPVKKVETTTTTKKVKTVKPVKKAASKCDDCKDKSTCTDAEKGKK